MIDNNKEILIRQMEEKIARLEKQRLELDRKYLGMLIQYGRTTAFRESGERLERKVADLKKRLDRIREQSD